MCTDNIPVLFGPTQVIAVGHHDYRLKYAEEHGSFPINSHKEYPVAKIKEMTGGRGADVAIEATGNKEALIGALTCLKKGGEPFLRWSLHHSY